jgi:hypothetical protein
MYQAQKTNMSPDQPTQQEEAQSAAAPRKANGRSPLFWVNADVQSVKGGSREATLKRIRSHVMSEHNRKKRLENTRRYNKSKTWKNLAFRPETVVKTNNSSPTSLKASSSTSPSSSVTSSPPGNASSKDSTSPESTQDVPLPTESVSKLGSETAVAQTLSVPPVIEKSKWIPTNTHSPWSTLGASQMDPFNAAQVPVSNSHFQHLRLCKSYPLYHYMSANPVSFERPRCTSCAVPKPWRPRAAKSLGRAGADESSADAFVYHHGSDA